MTEQKFDWQQNQTPEAIEEVKNALNDASILLKLPTIATTLEEIYSSEEYRNSGILGVSGNLEDLSSSSIPSSDPQKKDFEVISLANFLRHREGVRRRRANQ